MLKLQKKKKRANLLVKQFVREVVGDYSLAGSRRNDAPGNIRAGRLVIGNKGNILSDEEGFNPGIKTVRIIVRQHDGKVLAVVDEDDNFKFGLPGGVIEPGEDALTAAKRELQEETGLIAAKLAEIRTDVIDNNRTTLFLARSVSGKIRSSIEGRVEWIDPEKLLSGCFCKYYKEVIDDVAIL